MTKVIFMGRVYDVKPDDGGSSCAKCAFNIGRGTAESADHKCIREDRMTTTDGNQYQLNCRDSGTYYVEAL